MKPAHALAEDFFPVKITGLKLRRGFVATVIKHHRCPNTLSTITVNSGHVRPMNSIVFKRNIKRFYTHCPDPLRNQIANRIINHRRSHARLKAETIGKIGRDIKLAAAHMDIAMRRFAEWNNAGIEPMNQSAK